MEMHLRRVGHCALHMARGVIDMGRAPGPRGVGVGGGGAVAGDTHRVGSSGGLGRNAELDVAFRSHATGGEKTLRGFVAWIREVLLEGVVAAAAWVVLEMEWREGALHSVRPNGGTG